MSTGIDDDDKEMCGTVQSTEIAPETVDDLLAQIPERAPNGIGRPGYLTQAVARRVITALREGQTKRLAARLAQVHWDTLGGWLSKGDTDDVTDENRTYVLFRRAALAAEAEAEARAVRGVIAAGDADWKAHGWYLARKNPQDWAERSRESESGRSGVVINVGIALSPGQEQLQTIDTQWVSVPKLDEG